MDYDVLIVGARVAGASLALLLGERGHRVLMVDRDHFPSDTLSTHFMSAVAVPWLERLGVLAEVEALGFRRITRVRTWVEDCLFEGPGGPAASYALAPRRDGLDSILIRHARERGGAELREGTHAEGLIMEDGRVVGAMLRTPAGERQAVRSAVVVGADGKFSKVAKWVKAEHYHEVPAMRPIYYGYYRGLVPLPEPALELFFMGNQIGFIFPMRPDEDCLALEIQPEDFETFRANPQIAFEACWRTLPGMARRLQGAQLEGKLLGTRGVHNYFRKPYGPGWALIGDAGYLKDPSTGFGIGDALAQAFLLADPLDATLRGADWEASLSEFQRKRDEISLPFYRGTIASTQLRTASPESLLWLRAALFSPHLTRALAYWLASSMHSGDLPSHLQPGLDRVAAIFGTQTIASPASTVTARAD